MNRRDFEPWVPTANLRDLKILGKLSEELGELQSATARCIIQGPRDKHPISGKDNRQWLQEEIADVMSCLSGLVMHFALDQKAIEKRTKEKNELLRWWYSNDKT